MISLVQFGCLENLRQWKCFSLKAASNVDNQIFMVPFLLFNWPKHLSAYISVEVGSNKMVS